MFDFILRPFRRRFGRDSRYYAAVDDMFGFVPHNIELYKLALIHKSASVVLDSRSITNVSNFWATPLSRALRRTTSSSSFPIATRAS